MFEKIFKFFGYVPEYREVDDHGMERYPDTDDISLFNFVNIDKIIVLSERDKIELLKAIRYLHDNPLIDSNYYAVNSLIHVYTNPGMVEIKE